MEGMYKIEVEHLDKLGNGSDDVRMIYIEGDDKRAKTQFKLVVAGSEFMAATMYGYNFVKNITLHEATVVDGSLEWVLLDGKSY